MAILDFPSNPLVGAKYPQPGIPNKPVYVFDGVKWTTFGEIVDDTVGASAAIPLMDADPGSVGVEGAWARGDHRHPSDTSRAPLASPVFTGDPKAPTPAPGDSDTSIATTAFVANAVVSAGAPGTILPLMDGTATVGVALKYAHEDHVHPSDTTRAPLDSPVFTGDARAETRVVGDNDTSIATTAFVAAAVAAGGGGGGGGASVLVSSTPPAGAADNSLWWEDDTGQLFIRYNDGVGPPQWVSASGTNSGAIPVAVSSTPPLDAADNSLWWEDDTGQLYIRYNDGTTTQWTVAVPQPDTATFLSKSPQTLTAAEQVQSRINIAAAPFDAMAYGGMQINGGMEVSQELGASGTGGSGFYFCDGWKLILSGTMAVGAVATPTSIVPGFPACFYINISVAQASLGAGHFTAATQIIEGYRIARLAWGTANAQPVTIGFWSQHFRTGVYSGAIRNVAGNRSYVYSYTHNASNVSQYNVVTIPGDTTGTWPSNNTGGMQVDLTMACGTTYTAPSANTWLAGNYVAAPGQINGVASTSDIFRITGVTILPGIQAPTAAQSQNIMRAYGEELVTCKRYWETSYPSGVAPGTAVAGRGGAFGYYGPTIPVGQHWAMFVTFPTLKRATPTFVTYSTQTGTINRIYDISQGADWVSTIEYLSNSGAMASITVNSGVTNNLVGHWVADARL